MSQKYMADVNDTGLSVSTLPNQETYAGCSSGVSALNSPIFTQPGYYTYYLFWFISSSQSREDNV